MIEVLPEPVLAALFGLGGGVVLGLAARLGRFCTLGAIEDALYGESYARLAVWGVAIGVAILGVQALITFAAFDPGMTIYSANSGNLVGAIFGGLTFGYGMALSGNCGYGALARLGGGDFRALMIVLVMGLGAYVTISGPIAPLRVAVFQDTLGLDPLPSIAGAINTATGMPSLVISSLLAAGFLLPALKILHRDRCLPMALTGTAVGLAVVSGWWGTMWLAREGFDALPVVSHTFAAPVGESLVYLMTSTGNTVSFGVGSVTGVLLGAFAGSVWKGHFRWEACDDPRELKRQILGAFLMGVGAVIATGCSIGQGITGISLLNWASFLAALSILLGAGIGLRHLIFGFRGVAEN